jgi:hypothetical protein
MNNFITWVRSKKHDSISNYSGNSGWWLRVNNYLSRSPALLFFLKFPIVSFYPNTLQAMGMLNTLPDIEETISGKLNTSTLKRGNAYFRDISEIILNVYKVSVFDEIKFKRSGQSLLGFEATIGKPVFHGGEYSLELINQGKVQSTIYEIDGQFLDIKRELDRMMRKRLAILALIFAIAAVLVGVLK